MPRKKTSLTTDGQKANDIIQTTHECTTSYSSYYNTDLPPYFLRDVRAGPFFWSDFNNAAFSRFLFLTFAFE